MYVATQEEEGQCALVTKYVNDLVEADPSCVWGWNADQSNVSLEH